MQIEFPDVLIAATVSVFLMLAMCAALVLVLVSTRRPADLPLAAATALIVLGILVVAVLPQNVPVIMGLILAMLGTALAVIGGNPVVRRVLTLATRGRVADGDAGGILVTGDDEASDAAPHEVMRGGTTIGYLERLAAVLSILAGFPEAIAMVVAIKGIGRFSELASAEARERFIIGTLASLLWACAVAMLVRLAIW